MLGLWQAKPLHLHLQAEAIGYPTQGIMEEGCPVHMGSRRLVPLWQCHMQEEVV
jgi:hypothetical protein